MDDCLFCKIARGEIPSNAVYEDDKIIAFHDLEPVAPVHILVIPKVHVGSMNDISDSNIDSISHLIMHIKSIAEKLDLEKGYRVVTNTGSDGGQSVSHLHFHILGKRQMMWPPG